jgi:DNA-directed RNA polymerase subunit alpha
LKRAGIITVGEVLELLEKGEDAIMSIRNFGEKSMDELVESMTEKGYLETDEEEAEETETEEA